jgi:hypothetical protein
MKVIVFAIATMAIFISSCVSQRSLHHLSTDEYNKFSTSGDSIMYNNRCVAVYSHLEWEYYRGRKTLEVSLRKVDNGVDDMADKIVNYFRTKNGNVKIELVIPNIPFKN